MQAHRSRTGAVALFAMAIVATELAFGYPGRDELFFDVSFKVGSGGHVALIGDNAVGKSTLLRILAGQLEPAEGTYHLDGAVHHMPQSIGQHDEPVSVREFLAGLAPTRLRDADRRLRAAEERNAADASPASGTALATAIAEWGDAGGFTLESVWADCVQRVLRQPLEVAAERPVTELSGGERKRLALEILFQSDADILLLDEPDNFLDVPGKLWLEDQLRSSKKTILMVSHDRELLSRAVDALITIEASGAWVHGGTFAGYHDAREARNEQLGDALERWRQEERRLFRSYKRLKQQAAISDVMASRAAAAENRWERFVAAGPPPAPPADQRVHMRLRGGDTGRRVLRCTELDISGLTLPFSVDVHFGERVAVIGPNGSGKSHFLRLVGGAPIDHDGEVTPGARVVIGSFSQTNERADLVGRQPLDAVVDHLKTEEAAMRALARYGLAGAARSDYRHLSGGQQARLQILTLEASGANFLLLDEPTDNLDLVSSEALESALEGFNGTVMAVTHDRWFLRGFDRFLVFPLDGDVSEALDLASALQVIESGDAARGEHMVGLGAGRRP